MAQDAPVGAGNASSYFGSTSESSTARILCNRADTSVGSGLGVTSRLATSVFEPASITCGWSTPGHLTAAMLSHSTTRCGSSERLAITAARGPGGSAHDATHVVG